MRRQYIDTGHHIAANDRAHVRVRVDENGGERVVRTGDDAEGTAEAVLRVGVDSERATAFP